MKRKFKQYSKKVFIVVLAMSMIISGFMLSTSAASPEESYIRFTTNPNARINSDGTFEFYVHYALSSGEFKANGTSITISTTSYVFNASTRATETSADTQYKVILYRSRWYGNQEIGSYYGYATGQAYSRTFDGLVDGATYFFKIGPTDPNFDLGPLTLDGWGYVSNVTVK